MALFYSYPPKLVPVFLRIGDIDIQSNLSTQVAHTGGFGGRLVLWFAGPDASKNLVDNLKVWALQNNHINLVDNLQIERIEYNGVYFKVIPGAVPRRNNRAPARALNAANAVVPVRNGLTPEEQAQLDAAIAVPTPDIYWNIPRGTHNSRYGELIQEGDELINLHGNAHFIPQHEGLHGVHKKARANMISPYMWRNITNPNSDPPIRRFRAHIVGGRRTRRRTTRKPRSTRSKH